jgi:hypothetical protein
VFLQDGEEGPGQELSDIAAQAASLQPKGYTLQTTEVIHQFYLNITPLKD